MKTPKRFTKLAVAVVSSAVLVAGCGGDDAAMGDMSGGTSSTPTSTAPLPAGDTTTPGSTVSGDPNDPNAAANGAPVGVGTAPDLPDLKAGNINGGFGKSSSGAMFKPLAVEGELGESTGLGASDPGFDTGGLGGFPAVTEQPSFDQTPPPVEETPVVEQTLYTGARIAINGKSHNVNINDSFPKVEPVFRLLAVTKSDIEIELIAGSFTTDGSQGVFLNKGETVSLVNSSVGMTYRVRFIKPNAPDTALNVGMQ